MLRLQLSHCGTIVVVYCMWTVMLLFRCGLRFLLMLQKFKTKIRAA